MKPALWAMWFALAFAAPYAAAQGDAENVLDILVTFENQGASATGAGSSAPYRNRKRYSIAANAKRHANAIADEYSLTEIDHWPIRSLSVYCFVYRIPANQDRDRIIEKLALDDRIESVQPLHEFETGSKKTVSYNDKYANLQHGLDVLGIAAAHQYSLGAGVRVAVVDSNADTRHEDLIGRIGKKSVFADSEKSTDEFHGTAVTSVIGARANNNKGIVGVAPEARLELLVSCWANAAATGAVCDTFTLAKALDQTLNDPPDILNLSLTGPHDPLLERMLLAILQQGVIVVAADPEEQRLAKGFPASLPGVIAVRSSSNDSSATMNNSANESRIEWTIYAPGNQIMVALPNNAYDFRSGSSLAAAHVTGVIALLLAEAPEQTRQSILNLLKRSQDSSAATQTSIHACEVLLLAKRAVSCPPERPGRLASKLKTGT